MASSVVHNHDNEEDQKSREYQGSRRENPMKFIKDIEENLKKINAELDETVKLKIME